ncbi:MAG TPA: lysylphosphatidylglycerol synthase transmembrane domain-containing protein [Bryobacteraceae bacterium]
MAARKTLLLILCFAVSLGSLAWVLKGSELNDLGAELRDIHWGWIALAVISDVAVYVIQGWRWTLLLTPIARIPVFKSVRAIYVGLFANEVLPFRTGEVLRCYLQARWSETPFSVILASALTERLLDGLWLVLGLAFVVKFVKDLPPRMIDAGYIIAATVLTLAAVLVTAMLQKNWALRNLRNTGWQKSLRVLIEDLNLIGFSRYAGYAALASLPYLLMQIVPIWAVMRAYGLEDTRIEIAAVAMIVLRLSSVVPQAPGNIGLFNAAAVMALQLFNYDPAFAKRFSLVLWSAVTLPLLVCGSIALVLTGSRLGELLEHAENHAAAAKPEAPVVKPAEP